MLTLSCYEPAPRPTVAGVPVASIAGDGGAAMDEPFLRGELVTLREYRSAAEPLGRIVSVTPGGDRAEVVWFKNPGHEHQITLEPTEQLRRVHESELDPGAE